MKRLRWQIIIVILALIAIAVLLVSQRPESLPGIEPVNQPVTGGVYTEALIGSLNRLNPVLDYGNPADQAVDKLLFSSLIKFSPRSIPEGDLAESWGISRDGTVYNLSIRNNAVWHDGKPVTSGDVIFTIELMKSESIPLPEDIREFWNQIELNQLDEKTLQFILPEPFAPFLDYLTFGVLPEHLLGGLTPEEVISSSFNINPVGSGPYQFRELIMDGEVITGVSLTVFEEYYKDPAYIQDIEFYYVPDAASALNAYQNEVVMGISEIEDSILNSALATEDFAMHTGRLPRFGIIYLNLDNPTLPFFQDNTVRQALLMGVNRRRIIDKILLGQAIPIKGPIFPESWAYYDGGESLEYNPELAVKMLREAGYSIPAEGGNVRANEDGVKLSFDLVYPAEVPYQTIAQSIQADWSKIGVQANLVPVSYEAMINDYLEPRNFESALVEINIADSPDPDPYPFWHQAQATGGQNYSGWDDRQASEYIEQARVIVDFEERLKRYKNFQVRFATELPALLLYSPVFSFGVNQQVQGVSMGPIFKPSDRFNNITSWFLQSETEAARDQQIIITQESETE